MGLVKTGRLAAMRRLDRRNDLGAVVVEASIDGEEVEDAVVDAGGEYDVVDDGKGKRVAGRAEKLVKSKGFYLQFDIRYLVSLLGTTEAVLFHHYERGAARCLPASVEQLFGKEYDYRSGKVALDGVGGRPCRVVAAIHSCCSAGIHGAEGASRRVVATEKAERRRACSYGSRGPRGVVADVETA